MGNLIIYLCATVMMMLSDNISFTHAGALVITMGHVAMCFIMCLSQYHLPQTQKASSCRALQVWLVLVDEYLIQ